MADRALSGHFGYGGLEAHDPGLPGRYRGERRTLRVRESRNSISLRHFGGRSWPDRPRTNRTGRAGTRRHATTQRGVAPYVHRQGALSVAGGLLLSAPKIRMVYVVHQPPDSCCRNWQHLRRLHAPNHYPERAVWRDIARVCRELEGDGGAARLQISVQPEQHGVG